MDGKMEVVIGSEAVNSFPPKWCIYIVEHTGEDNQYQLIFSSQVPSSNPCTVTEGNDLDGDGKPEFFVIATGVVRQNGSYRIMTHIVQWEASGNNNYEITASIRWFNPTANSLTWEFAYTADVDGDGKKELIVSAGNCVAVLKSTDNDTYRLLWFKQFPKAMLGGLSMNVGNVTRMNRLDILVSYMKIVSKYKWQSWTDIFSYSRTKPFTFPSASSQRPDLNSEETVDNSSTLYPVYPNPANPGTIIRFEINNKSKVNVKIYNIIGKEVTTLIENVELEEGLYELPFDGKSLGLSSGIYFVRFQTDEEFKTQKFLLLK